MAGLPVDTPSIYLTGPPAATPWGSSGYLGTSSSRWLSPARSATMAPFLTTPPGEHLMTEEGDTRKLGPLRIPRRIQRISWRDLVASLGPVLLVSVVAIWIAVHFVRPAPPDTIVITSGPEGSIGRTTAEKYRKILARNGEKLEILSSEG